MSRRFLIALGAMLAVFCAMIGGIWYATSDGSAAQPQPLPPIATADPLALVTVGPIDLAKAPLGGIQGLQYVIVKDQPAPPPPPGSWEAVPIVQPRRGAIRLDLEDVQAQLSECFSPSIAARRGPVSSVQDAAPLQAEEATTLLLQLEVRGTELLIVDAPVESWGTATEGTIGCAQAILRNKTIASPGLSTGRHRVRYALAP